MELTRFDMKNQAIQERIATALETIGEALNTLIKTHNDDQAWERAQRLLLLRRASQGLGPDGKKK